MFNLSFLFRATCSLKYCNTFIFCLAEFGSNSTTAPTSSSSDPQPTSHQSITLPTMPLLPQSTIIAIAIVGSVLTVPLAIMIILLSCLLCNRLGKRENATKNQMGNGGQQIATQAHLVNNPAYHVWNNFNDRLVNNPAYGNRLTSNPAYNYNGDTDPYYSVILN